MSSRGAIDLEIYSRELFERCPRCWLAWPGRERGWFEGCLYVAVRSDGMIKVGSSIGPKRRAVQLANSTRQRVEILHLITSVSARLAEKLLHRRLGPCRTEGFEWYKMPFPVLEHLLKADHLCELPPYHPPRPMPRWASRDDCTDPATYAWFRGIDAALIRSGLVPNDEFGKIRRHDWSRLRKKGEPRPDKAA
jgi:hypothetical protein